MFSPVVLPFTGEKSARYPAGFLHFESRPLQLSRQDICVELMEKFPLARSTDLQKKRKKIQSMVINQSIDRRNEHLLDQSINQSGRSIRKSIDRVEKH